VKAKTNNIKLAKVNIQQSDEEGKPVENGKMGSLAMALQGGRKNMIQFIQ
jgi:hypothetical protein